jgi:hypothetical protein
MISHVIPAQAGTQFAGAATTLNLGSRLRGKSLPH